MIKYIPDGFLWSVKMLKRIFQILAAVGFSLAVPYELDAVPQKEKHEEQREQKSKTNQQGTKNVVPKLNSKNPEETLKALLTHVKKSKDISRRYRQIVCECLIYLSKIQTGRYIFSNLPDNVTIHIRKNLTDKLGVSWRGQYHVGPRRAYFCDKYIKGALKAKSAPEKQDQLLRFSALIAHELVHATQCYLQLSVCPGASYEDSATLVKFREMHALVDEHSAEMELLDLPSFAGIREKRRKNGALNVFLRRAQELQIKAGMSPAQARRFARTEFVRTFWCNTPDTPVRVGGEKLYVSCVGPFQAIPSYWNLSYARSAFDKARRAGVDYYTKTHGADIREGLNNTIAIIGLDLTADFVMQKKSFTFDKGRFIGYMDGVKQLEIDSLGKKGCVLKRFEQGKICRLEFDTQDEKGSYKDYFYGEKTLRATYSVKNKKISGIYCEYDKNGRQIISAPMKNGAADGTGWILENGKKIPAVFKKGDIEQNVHLMKNPKLRTLKYWQNRYLEENKK